MLWIKWDNTHKVTGTDFKLLLGFLVRASLVCLCLPGASARTEGSQCTRLQIKLLSLTLVHC